MTLEDRLREARESQDNWYDRMNRLWREAEEKLRSLNVPVTVKVRIGCILQGGLGDYEPEDGPCTEYLLGWYYFEDGFHICYGTRSWGIDGCDGSEIETWKPILRCSAEIRTYAAPAFEDLQLKMVEAAEEQASKSEQAAAALAEAIAKR